MESVLNGSQVQEFVGWDPEIFVVDSTGDLLPAYRFLPNKREAAENIEAQQRSFAYWDGFQAEFNVAPSDSESRGIDFLQEGMGRVLTAARKHDARAKLTIKNLFRIPEDIRRTAAEAFVMFGCNMSESAYGLEPVFFENPRAVPYRCAGGHIHFGGDEVKLLTRGRKSWDVVRMLDHFLALPCVALFDGIDDPRRREMYGRAGEFRLPRHGLEYRTLSNAWLCHPAITALVMSAARAALALRGNNPGSSMDEYAVMEVINNCDATKAREWIEGNWPLFSAVLNSDIKDMDAVERSKKLWLGGVANELVGFDNLEINWKLDGIWPITDHRWSKVA